MGLIIKLFCFLLALGIAGLFVLKKPDGSPWLSIDEFIPDTKGLTSGASTITDNLGNSTTSTKETQKDGEIYRWKDINGHWVYSDTPPENQNAESIYVSGDLNKDLTEVREERITEEDTATINPKETSSTTTPFSTLSPEKVSKLIEDTKNIQKLMDDRQSQIDELQK